MAIFPTRRPGWTDEQYADYLAGAEAGRRRQGNKTVAKGELKFRGRLGLGKMTGPAEKEEYKGGRNVKKLRGGSTEIVLQVSRPEVPDPPAVPGILDGRDDWQYRDVKADPGVFSPPEQDEGETEKKYQSRVNSARKRHEEREAAHAEYLAKRAEAQATYDAQMARYNERVAGMASEYISYAQLPGLAAVMGGLEVEVIIRPTSATAGMLPGFVEQLLGLPAPEPRARRGRASSNGSDPEVLTHAEAEAELAAVAGDEDRDED